MFSTLTSACFTAASTRLSTSLISLAISSTEDAVFCASLLISVATTEKPLPASPALAASMDALRDKREVSSEIFAINPVIPVISLEASPTLLIASTSCAIEFRISSMAFCTRSISLRPLRDISTVALICSLTFSLSLVVSATTPLRFVALSAISLMESEI